MSRYELRPSLASERERRIEIIRWSVFGACVVAVVFSILLWATGCAPRACPDPDLPDPPAELEVYAVTRVVDGDTFDARVWGFHEVLRFRLIGVDAPERGQPFANEAAHELTILLKGGELTLTPLPLHDGRYPRTFDRVLVYAFSDGIDAGEALLKRGLACPPDLPLFRKHARSAAYKKAYARRAHTGLVCEGGAS